MKDLAPEYQTSDLSFATILILHNKPILRLNVEGGRVSFVFAGDSDISVLQSNFLNRRLKVEPTNLLDTMRSLKAMAKTAISNGGR